MSGNPNSGRPAPPLIARTALDELARDIARLLEDEAGASARCAIELVRAVALELPARLNGARWGPPSHARKVRAVPSAVGLEAAPSPAVAPTKASAT